MSLTLPLPIARPISGDVSVSFFIFFCRLGEHDIEKKDDGMMSSIGVAAAAAASGSGGTPRIGGPGVEA